MLESSAFTPMVPLRQPPPSSSPPPTSARLTTLFPATMAAGATLLIAGTGPELSPLLSVGYPAERVAACRAGSAIRDYYSKNFREGGKEHLRQREWWTSIPSPDMSLACLVCQSVESPSHSFRSYSVSSSDNEGRCSAIANFLARRASLPAPTTNSSIIRSSKVTPHPSIPKSSGIPGSPRLVRSCAVRRDIVRDWNFEEVVMEH
ncbi:hypothetical protein AAG906_040557 [Vitis piasezkii]